MSELLIRNALIVDVEAQDVKRGDILIKDGLIAAVKEGAAKEASPDVKSIDADGLYAAPGLIDIHVHLREPGQTAKETIASGTMAAVTGGFTTIVCMPNTRPVIDSPSMVRWVQERATVLARCRVLVAGAITLGLEGEQMAPIGSMHEAGIVAITDDGNCVQNNELMKRAMQYASMFSLPVLDHCEEVNLSGGGVMHEGYFSTILGLVGIPSEAEEVIVARDILLAHKLGCHVHCQHISSGQSVELIREAKRRGVLISGEVTPHHFTLTDAAVAGSEVFWNCDGKEIAARYRKEGLPSWPPYDTNFKVNPPLRSNTDREALLKGLQDGTLEVIASDHAPHTKDEKDMEFDYAPFGIIGLETAFALALDRLYHTGILSLPELVAKFTIGPAKILKLSQIGRLKPGCWGDITLFDPNREWIYNVDFGKSKSKNSPFHGWKLRGKPVITIVGGKIAWQEDGELIIA